MKWQKWHQKHKPKSPRYLLGITLSFILTLSILPTSAFAEVTAIPNGTEQAAEAPLIEETPSEEIPVIQDTANEKKEAESTSENDSDAKETEENTVATDTPVNHNTNESKAATETTSVKKESEVIPEKPSIEEGIVEKGTVEEGTVEEGTVEEGTVEEGTVEEGTVQKETSNLIQPNIVLLPEKLQTTDAITDIDQLLNFEKGPLGIASEFNVFLLSDDEYAFSNTDAEGRIAVKGPISANGFGIGHSIVETKGRATAVSAGKLTTTNGNIGPNGTGIVLANEIHISNGMAAQRDTSQDADASEKVDAFFSDASRSLNNLSAQYAAMAPTGDVKFEYSALVFTGTNSDLNVFELKADWMRQHLAYTHEILFQVPKDSKVLVNITGEGSVALGGSAIFWADKNAGINLGGRDAAASYAPNLLWNIPGKVTLQLNGSMGGSFLAPKTDMEANAWSQFNGNLIANSFQHTGGMMEMHNILLHPDFPAPNSGGPGETPTNPGDGGETPTNPGDGGETPTNPGDGGETPTNPGDGGETPTNPGDGGETPTNPGDGGETPTNPGDGGETPTNPGDGGETPTNPGDGGETPTNPGDGGETPTNPGDGGETPTNPGDGGGGGGGSSSGGRNTPSTPNTPDLVPEEPYVVIEDPEVPLASGEIIPETAIITENIDLPVEEAPVEELVVIEDEPVPLAAIPTEQAPSPMVPQTGDSTRLLFLVFGGFTVAFASMTTWALHRRTKRKHIS